MVNRKVLFLVFLLSAALATGAMAKEIKRTNKQGKPGVVAVEVITRTATVKSVDYVKKTAVLEDEDGKTIEVDAREARNLDRVLVGDKVNVKYTEEVALYVRKADAPPKASAVETVALAPKGAMPGGAVTNVVQIQATVEGVNYKDRTISLKGPAGNVRSYHVSKQVKRLKEIKKGDQVVLDVTQALALEVVKP